MPSNRTYWSTWMNTLQRLGLAGLAAWLLEAGGPLNVLGAQILYIGQPLVSSSSSAGLGALANLLEQEDESRAFAALLKGQTQ
jgi:hypothetical protein